MLRFNFQQSMQHSAPQPNFNTSYVTVQQIYLATKAILDDISIHLMLRFNIYIF